MVTCENCLHVFAELRQYAEYLEATGRDKPLPEHIVKVFEAHTGRDINGRRSGREPTNELCNRCYHILINYLKIRKLRAGENLLTDDEDDSFDSDSDDSEC